MLSGAGLLLRGPPLSPGVVRGVGTTSRDPLPRAPLSVGASAAEWEILDGKRVDLQSGAPGQAGPGSGPCRARLAPPGPGPRALPGPACHSRAEAPKSAGRGARRARRGENRPGKPSCPGPSAAHRPARSLTAGPGQEGLPGPFCARRAGEEKTSLAKARSAARERPLLTRPGPAGAPAGPGTGPARARPTYVRGPSYILPSYSSRGRRHIRLPV